jgi:hypothetical protein
MTDAPQTTEFPIPDWMRKPLRVMGVGRVADNPRALLVLLTEIPTDNELRAFHDYVRYLECYSDQR